MSGEEACCKALSPDGCDKHGGTDGEVGGEGREAGERPPLPSGHRRVDGQVRSDWMQHRLCRERGQRCPAGQELRVILYR